MPIKRRKSRPIEEAVEASTHDEDSTTARHPYLSGIRLDVYRSIEQNPNCTRNDVAKDTNIKSSTCTARIKELIDEGFVVEPYGITKLNSTGVRSRCLHVTDRKQGSSPLDKVRLEVKLTIDCNGVYGAAVEVVGGKRQRGAITVIKRQKITVTAPHPDTYEAAVSPKKVQRVSRHELQLSFGDIIEGDATPLED